MRMPADDHPARSLAAAGVRFQTPGPVDRGLGPMAFTAGDSGAGVVFQLLGRKDS